MILQFSMLVYINVTNLFSLINQYHLCNSKQIDRHVIHRQVNIFQKKKQFMKNGSFTDF